MSIARRAAISALWATGGRWGQMFLALATATVLARIIGPEGYGLVAMAFVVLAFGDIFVGGALSESLIQHDSPSPGQIHATFLISLALGLALWILLALFRHDIASFFGHPALAPLLAAMGAILPLTASGTVPLAILQRDLRQKEIVRADMISATAASTLGLALVIGGAGVWSIAGMELFRVGLRSALYAHAAQFRPGFYGKLSDVHELSRFNFQILASRLLAYTDRTAPRGIVGAVLGAQAIGYFALAQRLLEQLQGGLTGALASVGLATAARTKSDLAQVRVLLLSAIRLSALICYPVFLGFCAVATLAVPLIFGPAWSEAVPVIQLTLLVALRTSVTTFNTSVLRGIGRPGYQLAILGAGTALTVILVPLALPYGIEAVAGAMLIRNFATWPLAAVLMRKAIGLSIRDQIMAGRSSLIAALLMAALVYLLGTTLKGDMPDGVVLALCVLAGVGLYAGFLALLERALAARLLQAVRLMANGNRPAALACLRGGENML